jgi:hypothetical protein
MCVEGLRLMRLRELIFDDGIMISLSSSYLNPLYHCTVGAYAERRNGQDLKAGKACSLLSAGHQLSHIAVSDQAYGYIACEDSHWPCKDGFDFDGSRILGNNDVHWGTSVQFISHCLCRHA